MSDLIDRDKAIDTFDSLRNDYNYLTIDHAIQVVCMMPSAEPEIIRCKDCKFYIPMNREIKTGICNLTMHQNFGDDWFCAGAERRKE